MVGDLDPFQACEFRIVLRHLGQADWIGQSSPRMVTEDGEVESTIDAAPIATPIWREEGGSGFALSWGQSRGRCREQSRYELQAAAGGEDLLDPPQQTWVTIAGNVLGTSAEADCPECCSDPAGCIFRVRPLDVRGWSRPGSASATVLPAPPPAAGGGVLKGLLLLLLLLILGAPVFVVVRAIVRAYEAGRSINPAEVLEELTEQARALPTTLRDMARDVRENTMWLSRQWLSAAGLEGGLYGKAFSEEQDDDDDDGTVVDGLDMSTDDFAPIEASVPKRLGARKEDSTRDQLNGFVDIHASTNSDVPDEDEMRYLREVAKNEPRTVMRL